MLSMGGDMRKRAKVLDIDDGGSFQRLVHEAQEALEDKSPAQVINLVQFEVIKNFVNRIRRDAMYQKLQQTNNNNIDLLACFIPKKKRGTCSGKDISTSSSSKKSNSLHFYDQEADEEKGFEKKRNKPKKRSITIDGSLVAMPSKLKRRIEEKGGNEIKLVIIKQVYQTDVSQHHDRLSIPSNQIRDPSFLKKEETTFLAKLAREKRGKQSNKGLSVKLMEPCGAESEMIFVKWELKSSDSYALRTSWNAVLCRNYFTQNKYFEVNDIIQLWSFRVEGRLWFALTKAGDESSHNAAASPSYVNLQEED